MKKLRKCEFHYWAYKTGSGKHGWSEKPIDGYFHAWGIDYEEFESGPGQFTVGIVEDEQGNVHHISDVTKIKFLDNLQDRDQTNKARTILAAILNEINKELADNQPGDRFPIHYIMKKIEELELEEVIGGCCEF